MIIFMLGQIGGFDKGPDQILGTGHYIAGGGGVYYVWGRVILFLSSLLGGGLFLERPLRLRFFLAYKYLPQVFKLTFLFF